MVPAIWHSEIPEVLFVVDPQSIHQRNIDVEYQEDIIRSMDSVQPVCVKQNAYIIVKDNFTVNVVFVKSRLTWICLGYLARWWVLFNPIILIEIFIFLLFVSSVPQIIDARCAHLKNVAGVVGIMTVVGSVTTTQSIILDVLQNVKKNKAVQPPDFRQDVAYISL